jgi:hypothetical protein
VVIEFEARKQNGADAGLLTNQQVVVAPQTHRHAEPKYASHQSPAQELINQLQHAGRWGRRLPQHADDLVQRP